MSEAQALAGGDGAERADLVDDHGGELVRGLAADPPPAEAVEVEVPGMGADGDAVAAGERHRARHDHRVAGVEPAGDARGGDDLEELLVVPHPPGAEALTEIAVHVDARGHPLRMTRAHRRVTVTAGRASAPTPPWRG